MAPQDPASRAKKSLVISLAMGALLIPMAAFVASSLVNQASGQEPAATSTTLGRAMEPARPEPDLDLACGPEGLQLVTVESDGSITDIQQAALDALRDICASAGKPLPAPATVATPSPAPTVTVPTTTAVTAPDDGHDDDHDDDDDHRGRGRGGDNDDGHDDREADD